MVTHIDRREEDTLRARSRLDPDEVAGIQKLLDTVEAADGQAPLDEQRWLRFRRGEGFVALVAQVPGADRPAGYAQLERHGDAWTLALAVDPAHPEVAGPLADEVAEVVTGAGGGLLQLWVSQPRPLHEQVAATLGLAAGRSLYQMRRPLPTEEPSTLATRAFVPGQDEAAWLEVNNRAFAWHPEQGGWDLAELEAHETLPWFDPEGFRIYEVDTAGSGRPGDRRMAGFCWTKVHATTSPPMGEIYVIAADPDFAGGGLGRRLTLAGLDHLARSGLTVGMLYVDADNVRAVKLYVDMGFVVHHVDTTFSGTLRAR